MKNVNLIVIGFVAIVFLIIGSVMAAGFHYANEIVPGAFQDGDYSFNGNLGIGTSSPIAVLEVRKSGVSGQDNPIGVDKGVSIRVDQGPSNIDLNNVDNYNLLIHNSAYAGTGIADPQGTRAKILFNTVSWNGWNSYAAIVADSLGSSSAAANLVFLTQNSTSTMAERMRIISNGNVGIGTSNPQVRLHVVGGNTILEQEPWQNPTFQNGWENYLGYNPAGYFKDSLGIVHLRGLVKSGTISQCIFTLPVGYRPANEEVFSTISGGFIGRVDVFNNGCVYASSPSVNSWLSLDGMTFRVAN